MDENDPEINQDETLIQEEQRANNFRQEIQRRYGRNRNNCLLYTSPSPRDLSTSRMPSSA